MSALLDRIKADSITARKERAPTAGCLTFLLSEITNKEKSFSPNRPVTEDEIVAIVRKQINNTRETLTAIEQQTGDRMEAERQKLRGEIAALEVYLPQQMTEEAIRAIVEARKAAGENIGQIMGFLKTNHAGQYDGSVASRIVKQVLAA